jgi:anti-sigma factor RsiW
MNEYDDKSEGKWEKQINALLDGELNQTDADELKSEATDDRDLARAIVEAYQLQQAMDEIHVERAPSSLNKRLLAIPREHAPRINWLQPRWAMALAAIPLVIITLTVMQPGTPSAGEIAQARHDLAIAFAYLDKAGQMTGREIESKVGNTMSDAITGSVIRNIKSQYGNSKEKKA